MHFLWFESNFLELQELRSSHSLLNQVLKLSIVVWLILLLRCFGSNSSYRNCVFPFLHQCFFVTIWVQYCCLKIPSFMHELSMWIWTFICSTKGCLQDFPGRLVLHVPASVQLADSFIKPLSSTQFIELPKQTSSACASTTTLTLLGGGGCLGGAHSVYSC